MMDIYVPNAPQAFVMNVLVSLLTKGVFRFCRILAGLVKDAFIEPLGASILGESVVGDQ